MATEATTLIINRKSEALTTAEWSELKDYRNGFTKEVACALSIGIDRTVLNRVLLTGKGRPDTIEKIRAKLVLVSSTGQAA